MNCRALLARIARHLGSTFVPREGPVFFYEWNTVEDYGTFRLHENLPAVYLHKIGFIISHNTSGTRGIYFCRPDDPNWTVVAYLYNDTVADIADLISRHCRHTMFG